MEFKFRKGKIFKIENGVKTQVSQEEYKASKRDWTIPPTKTTPVTENGQDFLENE